MNPKEMTSSKTGAIGHASSSGMVRKLAQYETHFFVNRIGVVSQKKLLLFIELHGP